MGKIRKILTILGAIALVALVAIFAVPASVPLVAEELESSPLAGGQEETRTMLDHILSQPGGEEFLKLLPQEAIDRFAATPMPPPKKEQPKGKGFVSRYPLTHVLNEDTNQITTIISVADVYPADLLPEEIHEARLARFAGQNVRILSEAEFEALREKDKEAGAVEDEGTVIQSVSPLGARDLPFVDNMDWDCYEEGYAVSNDSVLLAVYNWLTDTFDFSTDLVGNGYTDNDEILIWVDHWLEDVPGELATIRSQIDSGDYVLLDWNGYWDCKLRLVEWGGVIPFVGIDGGQSPSDTGWINVHCHDRWDVQYECGNFASETATCAYKSLGYGFLPLGLHYHPPPAQHWYNMFLKDIHRQ